ncbi:hypothetical protein EJV46_01775 [Roseococcus sp. SYP-B2431]|nr:hypothetical protein EJV46_01775 [Roseococcus sp. SYP-B2431]
MEAISRTLSPQAWIERYVTRLVELSAGEMEPPMPDPELRAFALTCARGGYPAFRNDDPAECAEAEFMEWRTDAI